jgi:transposase
MDRIYERVAGLDVHRDSVAACVRVPGRRGGTLTHKQRFSTMTTGLGQLRGWLVEHRVEVVGMEATGVYWKPPFYALEGHGFELWLCGSSRMSGVIGRGAPSCRRRCRGGRGAGSWRSGGSRGRLV